MKQCIPVAAAVLALAAYGVAEGLWTNRWFPSTALVEAAARVEHVPRVIGDWESVDREIEARVLTQAEIVGYISRVYINRVTGAEVSVLLVCGRPGPTALHSPEVCYPGAGYAPAGERVRHDAGAADSFWVGQFQKGASASDALRIFWAWNGAGAWQAAASPRVTFGHHAALYKLYVIRPLSRSEELITDDPALEFLELFLPQVQRTLFDEAAPAGQRGGQS